MVALVHSHPAADPLHAKFLALVPRIETHARIYFRGLTCPITKADAIQECVSLAWRWFLRLEERGKDVMRFPMAFAALVARAVRSGRRLTGIERGKDVLSPRAQARHGFTVERLPVSTRTAHDTLYSVPHGQELHDIYEERLADNTRLTPDRQAMFRIDFAALLKTLSFRERKILKAMARNERTTELANLFHLSASRISQLRRQFQHAWIAYCDGDDTIYCRRSARQR